VHGRLVCLIRCSTPNYSSLSDFGPVIAGQGTIGLEFLEQVSFRLLHQKPCCLLFLCTQPNRHHQTPTDINRHQPTPQQVPDLDAIVVPVSGGGMLSGIALAAKSLRPGLLMVAAEPSGTNGAADVAAAKERGELVAMGKPITIADGLQVCCWWACVCDVPSPPFNLPPASSHHLICNPIYLPICNLIQSNPPSESRRGWGRRPGPSSATWWMR
jgi:hypothetical protein